MKKIIAIIKLKLNKLINIDKKYQLSLNAATLSFYMLISISSLSILIFSFLNKFDKYFNIFFIEKIIKIIGEAFSGLVEESLTLIAKSPFSILVIISAAYSFSSIFYRLNSFTDNVYVDIKARRKIFNRISSILMFLMIVTFFIFELVIIFYSNYFLTHFLKIENVIINKLLLFILELLCFYGMISIIYIYLPPIKIKFKYIKRSSLLTTLFFYLFLIIFKLTFQVLYNDKKIIGLAFVFSISGYLFFIINYLICLEIIRNYELIIRKSKNSFVG